MGWNLFLACGYEALISDVNGEAVEVQQISSDDRHEDVGDDEVPRVPLVVVVEGKFSASVCVDGGAVGCLHDERRLLEGASDRALRDE